MSSQCPRCGVWLSPSHFSTHMRQQHSAQPRRYECKAEGCSKSFTSASTLRAHERDKHAPILACGVSNCSFTTKNPSVLEGHAHTHNAELLEANLRVLREQLERSEAALFTERAAVAAAVATAAAIEKEECDDVGGDNEPDDSSAGSSRDTSTKRQRKLTGKCTGKCGHGDGHALLGPLFRCARIHAHQKRCESRYHFFCAGYTRIVAEEFAFCPRCQSRAPRLLENADCELGLLDKALFVRGLERVAIPGDGMCLSASVAFALGNGNGNGNGTTAEDILRAAMLNLATHQERWKDYEPADVGQIRGAIESAQTGRPFRNMGTRWNSIVMDMVAQLMHEVVGRKVYCVLVEFGAGCEARFQNLETGDVSANAPPGDALLLCRSHRCIGLDHYDAVRKRSPANVC